MYQTPPSLGRQPRPLEYAAAIATAALGAVTAVASPISYWSNLRRAGPLGCRFGWERAAFIGATILVTLLAVSALGVLLRQRRNAYLSRRRLYWGLIGAFWLAWLALAFLAYPLIDTFWVVCRLVSGTR